MNQTQNKRNLKSKVISGLSWNAFSSITKEGIRYVVGIILARALNPGIFGMVAIALVFVGFAKVMVNSGLTAALIQRDKISDKHINTMFWFNVLFSLFLYGIVYISAPFISEFYNEPKLVWILRVLAIQFPIYSLSMVQISLLKRNFKFKAIAISHMLAAIVGGCFAIYLAWEGAGVKSIIAKSLITTLTFTSCIWVMSKWRPKIVWSKSAFKDLFSFGMFAAGDQILFYWSKKVDDLAIGKILGKYELGIYTRAYSFLLMPVRTIKNQVATVFFPTFSILKNDKKKLEKAYLVSTEVALIVLFPVMGLMFVMPDTFVYVILGSKWKALIPLLKIFAVAAMISNIGFPKTALYSLGLPSLYFKVNLAIQIVFIGLLFAGVYIYGIKGAAFAVLITAILNSLIMNAIFYWKAGFEKWSFIQLVATYSVLVTISSIFLLWIKAKNVLPEYSLANLLFLGALFISGYLILLFVLRKKRLRELWVEFRNK